jgi:anion-transporting  ArsA/GET3 family ATPase
VGAIRSQTDWVVDILADHAVTGLIAVTTPEEMPVRETIELVRRVHDDTDVEVAAVVVNRVLPELFSRSDEEVFERLREPALSGRLAEAVGGSVEQVFDAARLAVTLRRARATHLELLRDAIDPSIPLLYVPELFTRGYGLRTTGQVAEALSAELGY